MKKKAYIYPISARLNTGLHNPYVSDFMEALSSCMDFLNKDHPSGKGIFDIPPYLGKTDYIFLNWIEDLPDKKGGYIQSLFFSLLLKAMKKRNIKIVFTLHNKLSHYPENRFLKKWLFSKILRHSNYIITHAKEGIDLIAEMNKKRESVFYFPHPVKKTELKKTASDMDILIWGSIAPYKGIDVFLEHLQKKDIIDKYNILVCGKITSSAYEKKLHSYQRPNIRIINEFLDFEKLKTWIGRTKVVLFTYHKNSVLSSGALMDSIACKAHVLGPNTGAFKDLAEMNIIETYQNMDEIPDKIDTMLIKGQKNSGLLDAFIRDHSWEKFSLAFQKYISL